MRITADGRIKACLHDGNEYDLLSQPEDQWQAIIEEALANKKEEHTGMDQLSQDKNRTMTSIGG